LQIGNPSHFGERRTASIPVPTNTAIIPTLNPPITNVKHPIPMLRAT
jgi:hypothetical protein